MLHYSITYIKKTVNAGERVLKKLFIVILRKKFAIMVAF